MLLPYKGADIQRKRWLKASVVIVLLGALLIALPAGNWFATLSYDLPFVFRGRISNTNVVVLLEDRASLDALGETQWPPSRTVHAKLLDRLREEGVRLVVFDIFFRSERPEDDVLAAAMRRHGHVVLGAVTEVSTHQAGEQAGAEIVEMKAPPAMLRTNCAGWGLLLIGNLDSSFGVRKLTTHWRENDVAVWVAAQQSGLLPASEKRETERWINCYGPAPALDRISLSEVLELEGRHLAPGFLRGKTVFVGFDPSITPASGYRDVFATPYTRFGHDFSPGVEVLANGFANLTAGDWLRRMPTPVQCLFAALFYLGSLTLLLGTRRQWMMLTVPLLFVSLAAAVLILQWHFGLWFNWLVPGAVMLPMATVVAIACPRLPRIGFISYRRKGGDAFAWTIVHALWARGYDAFLDVKDLTGGEWAPQLEAAVDQSPNLILILSPQLFDRNPDEPDWVRNEILRAMAQKKKIVTVMMNGFEYPPVLPKGLENLSTYQQVEYHHDQANASFDTLVTYLVNKTGVQKNGIAAAK